MFNYAALWGPLNEQSELHWTRNKARLLLFASYSSDSLKFFVTIANWMIEIQQQQLSPLDLNMHNSSIFIRNKQHSSAESISQGSSFEI